MSIVDHSNKCIRDILSEMETFLTQKNISYDGSAFREPVIKFNGMTAESSIYARINDKLRRINTGNSYIGDDDIKDLAGYFIILMAYRNMKGEGYAEKD